MKWAKGESVKRKQQKIRKVVFMIFFIVIGLPCLNAQDQVREEEKVTWGIKAEANMSNFLVSGLSGSESKMKLGFTAGGFLNYNITEHFALQGELIYHYKSSDFLYDGQNNVYQYWGMEIPIYAMIYQKLSHGGRIYAGVGPYAEFGFSAELKQDGKKRNLYDDAAMNDFNSGFGIIVGYELPSQFQINAGYKVSVTNILDTNSSSATFLPVAVSLGIGYRFGK